MDFCFFSYTDDTMASGNPSRVKFVDRPLRILLNYQDTGNAILVSNLHFLTLYVFTHSLTIKPCVCNILPILIGNVSWLVMCRKSKSLIICHQYQSLNLIHLYLKFENCRQLVIYSMISLKYALLHSHKIALMHRVGHLLNVLQAVFTYLFHYFR